jgi:translocation and assembly module TamA
MSIANAFTGADIDAKVGAGLGVRWQSPLGPIRFDVAAPLDDPDRNLRIHVNLGPDL